MWINTQRCKALTSSFESRKHVFIQKKSVVVSCLLAVAAFLLVGLPLVVVLQQVRPQWLVLEHTTTY